MRVHSYIIGHLIWTDVVYAHVRYCGENFNTPEAKDEGIFQRFSVHLAAVISGETSLRLDQMCYLETIINQW